MTATCSCCGTSAIAETEATFGRIGWRSTTPDSRLCPPCGKAADAEETRRSQLSREDAIDQAIAAEFARRAIRRGKSD